MGASEIESARVVIGAPDRFVTLQPNGDRQHGDGSTVSFSVGGLSGTWTTSFQDVSGFTRDVAKLYRSLSGEALLSDNDSIGVRLTVARTGQITANVHIECGWSFGIEGKFAFDIPLDQSYLPKIIQDLSHAYPGAAIPPVSLGEDVRS